jgi:hypothetical protein
MPRPAFPELQGRPRATRHRRQAKPDRVLLGLKIATFLAACGFIAVVVLLAGKASSDNATPRPPAPKPDTSQPSDDATPPTPVPAAVDPPALRTEMTSLTGKPAPPPSAAPAPKPTTEPSQPPDLIFAVIGQPCPEPGRWSFTRDYQPVVCASSPPGSQPRWHRVI